MDWYLVVTVVGAILGTALIVAGWVVYRNGSGTGSKVFGAVAIAIGALLWVFIIFITPTTVIRTG